MSTPADDDGGVERTDGGGDAPLAGEEVTVAPVPDGERVRVEVLGVSSDALVEETVRFGRREAVAAGGGSPPERVVRDARTAVTYEFPAPGTDGGDGREGQDGVAELAFTAERAEGGRVYGVAGWDPERGRYVRR